MYTNNRTTTTNHFLNHVGKKDKRSGGGKKRRKSHIQYRTHNAIILITINQSPLHTRLGARIMTSRETGIYSIISCKLSGVPRGVFFFGPFTHYPSSSSWCMYIICYVILCSYNIFMYNIMCSVIFLLRGYNISLLSATHEVCPPSSYTYGMTEFFFFSSYYIYLQIRQRRTVA